ncbi:DUF4025 domain-containing protein [Virgibacillus sp. MSJ-26]|uniref:DUF4025 domain-containing protein n=1 Tax=Virgibacillus sp. MSJ-26 TaxID=2841522 RepID=UPI001C1280D8|nr:DUF4025 domain-containing protein [Virgibacillus sp. MSJ-26]MBU5466088.1 DUF4025 domain-containing protein [Virgibacillus sp. MSJ-26]
MSDQKQDEKKVDIEDSKNIAEHNYKPTKEQKRTETEEALSETNNQMQKQYYKGTIDNKSED